MACSTPAWAPTLLFSPPMEELLNAQERRKKQMPWNNPDGYSYTRASIQANAPALAGVYALYNAKNWIYIGESQNIQARLIQHANGDNACITNYAPPTFSYELSAAQQRVARQDQLIAELRPFCNRI